MIQDHYEPCPDEILAAIPWYPSLDDALRGEVESHVSQCSACRDELAFVHDDVAVEVDPEHRDRVYAKLLERIEKHEGLERSESRVSPVRVPREIRVGWRAALAAGLAFALLSGGLGALGTRWFESPQAAYETVGEAATAATLPAIDVVFRADATAESIHSALRAIGGQIVSGPTQLGVYRIQLGEGADRIAAAQMLREDELGVATFAEPAVR